jgi:hypothetical protein
MWAREEFMDCQLGGLGVVVWQCGWIFVASRLKLWFCLWHYLMSFDLGVVTGAWMNEDVIFFF